MDEKFHWFIACFKVNDKHKGLGDGRFIFQHVSRNINEKMIEFISNEISIKSGNNFEDINILGFSYLGEMTELEYYGGE